MFDLRKILKSQGIDLEELQKEGERVPKLLEALVKQGNGQSVALKELIEYKDVMLANQKKILLHQAKILIKLSKSGL